MAVLLKEYVPTLIPRPVRSVAGVGIFGGKYCFVVVGTGSGPEGSRPTANTWRPQGCGAEKECVTEVGCALPTENVSQLPFRRFVMAKVAIIGATGQVGSYAAHAVSQFPHVQEMCLYGRPGNEKYLDGLSHDMMDSFAARGTNTRITFGVEPKDLRGSDIIILTSGAPRKPNQTRLDLAMENGRVVKSYAEQVGRMAPDSILLVVTNPVDIMTTVALKYSGMMPHRVFGLGTHLDSMRLKAKLAEFFNVHVSEVHTRIIGEHGESMVPLWSATTIGGIQIDNLRGTAILPRDEILDYVKNSGSYIIKAKGATVFGPGDAIGALIRTIVEDENRMLTVSTQIRREIYGHEGVCISVPARVTRGGVFPIGVKLADDEVEKFGASVKIIRKLTEEVCATLDAEDAGCSR